MQKEGGLEGLPAWLETAETDAFVGAEGDYPQVVDLSGARAPKSQIGIKHLPKRVPAESGLDLDDTQPSEPVKEGYTMLEKQALYNKFKRGEALTREERRAAFAYYYKILLPQESDGSFIQQYRQASKFFNEKNAEN